MGKDKKTPKVGLRLWQTKKPEFYEDKTDDLSSDLLFLIFGLILLSLLLAIAIPDL